MRTSTPPRKLKARAYLLVTLISIFIATLIVCGIVFAIFLFSSITLISPITHTQLVSQDAQVAQVEAFCQQNHIACANVQTVDSSSLQITLDTGAVIILSTKKD